MLVAWASVYSCVKVSTVRHFITSCPSFAALGSYGPRTRGPEAMRLRGTLWLIFKHSLGHTSTWVRSNPKATEKSAEITANTPTSPDLAYSALVEGQNMRALCWTSNWTVSGIWTVNRPHFE